MAEVVHGYAELQNIHPLLGGELVSVDNLTHILRSCRQKKNLADAKNALVYISGCGLDTCALLGNYLVPVFAECGCVDHARQIFSRLAHQSEQSWTALIQVYVNYGDPLCSFTLYHTMLECHIEPSQYTFIALLKACAKLKLMEKSQELHCEIAKEGFEMVLYVGNSLVDVYAKCGLLAEAQDVLFQLPERDVVSWTALVAGYAEHGLGQEVFFCLEQMHLEHIPPNLVTFTCSLKACSYAMDIDKGYKIHSDIVTQGLERELFLCSTLVDMYCKCGLLEEACDVFAKLPQRDVVAWNALIAGYADLGFGEETLACVEGMQLDGVPLDAVTFLFTIKACASMCALERGEQFYNEIVKMGLERDTLICTALMQMYANCGLVAEARSTFDELSDRDMILWTALIAAYAEHGHGDEALICLEQMQMEGFFPDAVTLLCSLKACGTLGSIDKGQEIHSQVVKFGHERGSTSVSSGDASYQSGVDIHPHSVSAQASEIMFATALIDMYGKCGSMDDAQQVFDAMSSRIQEAWTALITGYARQGDSVQVFFLLESMKDEGIRAESVMFLSVLSACSHAGLVCDGQKYFEAMSEMYGITPSIKHYNCMADLLGRAGQLDGLIAMLQKLPGEPDCITWSAVLSACYKWDDVRTGTQAFQGLKKIDNRHAGLGTLMANIYASSGL